MAEALSVLPLGERLGRKHGGKPHSRAVFPRPAVIFNATLKNFVTAAQFLYLLHVLL